MHCTAEQSTPEAARATGAPSSALCEPRSAPRAAAQCALPETDQSTPGAHDSDRQSLSGSLSGAQPPEIDHGPGPGPVAGPVAGSGRRIGGDPRGKGRGLEGLRIPRPSCAGRRGYASAGARRRRRRTEAPQRRQGGREGEREGERVRKAQSQTEKESQRARETGRQRMPAKSRATPTQRPVHVTGPSGPQTAAAGPAGWAGPGRRYIFSTCSAASLWCIFSPVPALPDPGRARPSPSALCVLRSGQPAARSGPRAPGRRQVYF